MRARARIRAQVTEKEIRRDFRRLHVSKEGIGIMAPKAVFYAVKIRDLKATPANLLKQEMLARNGEAAISEQTYYLEDGSHTDVVLMGSLSQYRYLLKKLQQQPFKLKEIAREIRDVLRRQARGATFCEIGERRLNLIGRSRLIGILNVTPDSFFDGGKYSDVQKAVARGLELVREGADIIEVGGESARPGAALAAAEEIKRVVPVVEELAAKIDAPISIDTHKSKVAEAALGAGASMINDITGFQDPRMVALAAENRASAVIMHIKGRPKVAQRRPQYESIMEEIVDFLRARAEALEQAGLPREKIMVDPGIGFGKNTVHDLEVMHRFSELRCLGYPLVLAASHKPFIGDVIDAPPQERLHGTAAVVAWGVLQGANLLRVHDVRVIRLVAKMARSLVVS